MVVLLGAQNSFMVLLMCRLQGGLVLVLCSQQLLMTVTEGCFVVLLCLQQLLMAVTEGCFMVLLCLQQLSSTLIDVFLHFPSRRFRSSLLLFKPGQKALNTVQSLSTTPLLLLEAQKHVSARATLIEAIPSNVRDAAAFWLLEAPPAACCCKQNMSAPAVGRRGLDNTYRCLSSNSSSLIFSSRAEDKRLLVSFNSVSCTGVNDCTQGDTHHLQLKLCVLIRLAMGLSSL